MSLVGCVLPRSRIHWHAMRAQPRARRGGSSGCPSTPSCEVEASVEETVAAAREALRGKRFRIRKGVDGEDPHTLSGESGYLRETGNLVFHTALIVVIIGIAIGHLFGWRGDRHRAGGRDVLQHDLRVRHARPRPWVDTEALKPFSVTIDKLDVTFEERARGAPVRCPPRLHRAHDDDRGPGPPERQQTLKVNGPLQFGGASVFLLGNGYAPVVTVRDAKGNVTYSGATPVPAAGQQLPVGRRDQGRCGPAQAARLRRVLPAHRRADVRQRPARRSSRT